MVITNRPFDLYGTDFEKMWRFLQQDYLDRERHYVWLVSRLGDWKYGLWREKKYIPTFFRDHCQLWMDGFGQILGFVLSEDGENLIFIFTLHGDNRLYTEILDWTIQTWGPRYPSLIIEVHEYQQEALAVLESRGFHSKGNVAVTRTYDLAGYKNEQLQLKPGTQIINLADDQNYLSKAHLYKNGFSDTDQVSELDLLCYEYSRLNPAYDPRYDFSVITQEGTHIAGCVGFYDSNYRLAEVEKVCTHNQYRRQGFAEAVIRYCFMRLKERGIELAYITGYSGEANDLYEKLTPCSRMKWFHYERLG